MAHRRAAGRLDDGLRRGTAGRRKLQAPGSRGDRISSSLPEVIPIARGSVPWRCARAPRWTGRAAPAPGLGVASPLQAHLRAETLRPAGELADFPDDRRPLLSRRSQTIGLASRKGGGASGLSPTAAQIHGSTRVSWRRSSLPELHHEKLGERADEPELRPIPHIRFRSSAACEGSGNAVKSACNDSCPLLGATQCSALPGSDALCGPQWVPGLIGNERLPCRPELPRDHR